MRARGARRGLAAALLMVGLFDAAPTMAQELYALAGASVHTGA